MPLGTQSVLTLYTDRPSGFDPVHLGVAERAAQLLDTLLGTPPRTEQCEPPSPERQLHGPRGRDADVTALLVASMPADRSCAVLSVACADDRANATADVIALAALVLPTVRLSDGIMASAHDEVIAVLPGCEPEAENAILSRVQQALDASHDDLGDVSVGFAVASQQEGPAFAAGLQRARDRRRPMRRNADRSLLEAAIVPNGGRS